MKATDLRIGNIVKWNSKLLTITCVNIDYCIGYDSNKDELIHDNSTRTMFEGEPLTEEWLEKFGAVPEGDGYTNNIIKIGNKGRGLVLYANGYITEVKNHAPMQIFEHIKYVHQLQNLYFALTGEELTQTI